MLRNDEPFLSVNWLEHFGINDKHTQIAKVREHIELSLAKNGLFALLNVKKVIDHIQEYGEKKLSILHEPTPNDPSHSGVYGYRYKDFLVAELIAEIVINVYPSKLT